MTIDDDVLEAARRAFDGPPQVTTVHRVAEAIQAERNSCIADMRKPRDEMDADVDRARVRAEDAEARVKELEEAHAEAHTASLNWARLSGGGYRERDEARTERDEARRVARVLAGEWSTPYSVSDEAVAALKIARAYPEQPETRGDRLDAAIGQSRARVILAVRAAREKLATLRTHGGCREAPSQHALDAADFALDVLSMLGVRPTRVAPMADGGVSVHVELAGADVRVSFANDDAIVLVKHAHGAAAEAFEIAQWPREDSES